MPKRPAGYLVGSAAASNAPWSATVATLSAVIAPSFDVHVIVAREPGGREVFGARLDPLDGNAENNRGRRRDDVARIDGNFVAEAAADVGRDHVNLVFGDAGDERDDGAMRVRCLRRHIHREAPRRFVHVGDDAARFERRRMAALEPETLLDLDFRIRQRAVGLVAIAHFPVVDVVGFVLTIVAQNHFVRLGVERIGYNRQFFVLDFDELGCVVRGLACLGDDAGDFLELVQHLADGQHHLLVVAVEGRNPGQVGSFEIFAGDDGFDAGNGERGGRVDVLDGRVRIRAVHQRHPQHVRERDVVHVASAAANEARIFLALHREAECVARGLLRRRHATSLPRFAVRPPWKARRPLVPRP